MRAKVETQKYELMVIIKPLLPDNVRKSVQDKIRELITGVDGEVSEKEAWGKKYLAFPIKRQTEGYYMLYQVELKGKHLTQIKREMGLVNEILRFMFLKTK
jgi:small subunit ribosomal protein S6